MEHLQTLPCVRNCWWGKVEDKEKEGVKEEDVKYTIYRMREKDLSQGEGVERMCEKEIVVRRIWEKKRRGEVELCEERNDVEGEVKRDIIGFRTSLKGLRRDVVQLSLGKGVV